VTVGALARLLVSLLLVLPAAAAAQDAAALPDDLRAALEDDIRQSQAPEVCAGISLPTAIAWIGHPGYGRGPLAYGVPPFENLYAPGLYGVVIASEGGADDYLRLRARMDLLRKLGYFSAEPFTYVYPATEPLRFSFQTMGATQNSGRREIPVEQLRQPQPAIRYTLTAEGWLATRGKPCLPLGKLGLTRVLGLKLHESNGTQVAQVEYELGLISASAEFEPADLVRGFGEHVMRQHGARRMRTNFVRVAEGWMTERRMQALLRGGMPPRPDAVPTVVPPDAKAVQDAVDAYLLGAPSRAQACLALPGGADVSDNPTTWRAAPEQAFGADFFEFPDLHAERGRLIARGLALARDLADAGVLETQPATPLMLSGQPDELGGARYTLRPAYYRYVNRARGAPCLGYAQLQVTVGWFHWQSSTYGPPQLDFLGIARPVRLYEWVEPAPVQKALPVVALVRRQGIGVKGKATLAKGVWQVRQLEFLDAAYESPAHWKSVLATLPRAAQYRKANAAKHEPEVQAIVVRSGGTANVSVEGTGRPLILHLTSAQPVEWRLKVAPKAKLLRVIASTPTSARVRGAPAKVPVRICEAAKAQPVALPPAFSNLRQDPPPPPLPEGCAPPLQPPPERFFGSGTYAVAQSGFGDIQNNIAEVETRLGAEITVIQTEVLSKEFSVPRRYRAPGTK
jgi:hypothetical protein